MSNQENAVVMQPKNKVYHHIQIFLEKKGKDSLRTMKNYEIDIRQFFKIMKNKDIEILEENDLVYNPADVDQYQMRLLDRYSPSSVNRKMAALKSLFKYLKRNGHEVNIEAFDVEKLKDPHRKKYGILQWHEVERMIELVKTTYRGDMKAVLIELAAVTGFRLNALLNLTFDDIQRNGSVWTVKVIDKGQKVSQESIRDELYDKIMDLKKYNFADHKIFSLTHKTINKMMKDLCRWMQIPEERNITFHSLKKCGLNEVYMATKDPKAVQKQGKHSSMTTPFQYYLESENDPSKSPSLLVGQKIDFSVLDDIDKNDLIKILKQCDRGVQMNFVNQAKEYKKDRT